jgi:hypothetical protein
VVVSTLKFTREGKSKAERKEIKRPWIVRIWYYNTDGEIVSVDSDEVTEQESENLVDQAMCGDAVYAESFRRGGKPAFSETRWYTTIGDKLKPLAKEIVEMEDKLGTWDKVKRDYRVTKVPVKKTESMKQVFERLAKARHIRLPSQES